MILFISDKLRYTVKSYHRKDMDIDLPVLNDEGSQSTLRQEVLVQVDY